MHKLFSISLCIFFISIPFGSNFLSILEHRRRKVNQFHRSKQKKMSWWIQWSRWWFDLFPIHDFFLFSAFWMLSSLLWCLLLLCVCVFGVHAVRCVRHEIQYTGSIWSKRWRICINILSNMIYDVCPATGSSWTFSSSKYVCVCVYESESVDAENIYNTFNSIGCVLRHDFYAYIHFCDFLSTKSVSFVQRPISIKMSILLSVLCACMRECMCDCECVCFCLSDSLISDERSFGANKLYEQDERRTVTLCRQWIDYPSPKWFWTE